MIDMIEARTYDSEIGVNSAHVISAILLVKEPRKSTLTFNKAGIEGHKSPALLQPRRCSETDTAGYPVIHMMQQPQCNYDVKLSRLGEFYIGCIAYEKRPDIGVTSSCSSHIRLTKVNSDVAHSRKVLQDPGGPAR
jgi:hypothetical protein